MKKFVKKILILLLIVCICLLSMLSFDYFIIGPQYQHSYAAALIDKVARLESINEPKIILVGNSNVAFGFDSGMIEEEIGMPVVNLGLHAGLGNAFHEEIAKLNINEGDIVVVCPVSFYDDDTVEDPVLEWVTYDWNPSIAPIIRKKDYLAMVEAYPDYFKKVFWRWITKAGDRAPDDSYARTSFNEYGDVVYKPDKNQADVDELFKTTPGNVPWINDTCINRLNNLNTYCNDRGARMVIAGYPISYGKYSTYTKDDFAKFQDELAQRLDCDVISDYRDYFYPYDYFYDKWAHLTTEGAKVRTSQLISDLNNWMKDET